MNDTNLFSVIKLIIFQSEIDEALKMVHSTNESVVVTNRINNGRLTMSKSHILGYPRMGEQRELKKALEAYWNGKISQADLIQTQNTLEKDVWETQRKLGLDYITVGDLALYDHVLDASLMFGVIPERFMVCDNEIDRMFCMGRGKAPNGSEAQACEMTKWFDTNYHYIVPEFSKEQRFTLNAENLLNTVTRAKAVVGNPVKPVILGPLSFLWLGKISDSSKLSLLEHLIPQYNRLFELLSQAGVQWVQIDEPILTLDLDKNWKEAFVYTYSKLQFSNVNSLLTTYFGALEDNLEFISKIPVSGLHIDLCRSPEQLTDVIKHWPSDKVLSLGVVDGRNIWKNDLTKTLDLVESLNKNNGIHLGNIWIGSSCSLLHCPIDLSLETTLEADIKNWMAFAKQKIQEIALISRGLNEGRSLIEEMLLESQEAVFSRGTSTKIHDNTVKERISKITESLSKRAHDYGVRVEVQKEELKLPLLPTTTIGSFPQTDEIRKNRFKFKKGQITLNEYQNFLLAEIKNVITIQQELGLDILVHGEPERNDMVEYFGELLQGFTFTQNGWVQSYGSRCVKPPIIYGDVKRTKPMTLEWSVYAQSLTNQPVKGMLTGPVTILQWSFVRDDQPRSITAQQIALALRDEVMDLEKAGIRVIQIDEPAFREGLPLRAKDHGEYLDWASHCFRISASGVKDGTQIHTHMCYSEFNDIINAIADLDADVISIESSRSKMELLQAFKKFDYPNAIGPGVYDIHSPRIPSAKEIEILIRSALEFIPIQRLYVNPDCGLKTRNWDEVKQSLKNMVLAAKQVKHNLAK